MDLSGQVRKFQLTLAQFAMLELLYRRGALNQRKLAEELMVSDGEITHLVETLRKRNLATRRRRPKDRRFILISITSFGRWYMGYAEPSAVRIVARRLDPLSADEQEELIRLCAKIEAGEGERPDEKEIDLARDYVQEGR